MQDTDWRPTPCPHCGLMREARQHPYCQNNQCHYFGLTGHGSLPPKTERIMKKEQKYVWIKAGRTPVIITDLTILFRSPDFDADDDNVFELGPEVKLKMQIVTIPTHPVKREPSWENKE